MGSQKLLEKLKKSYLLWQFKMNSFIDGFLIELNEYPRVGIDHNIFTIKDYFYCDSNTAIYGHRGAVIPVDLILNKNDIPCENMIKSIINNKEPVMKRVIDINNQTEHWVFVPKEEN